MTGAQGPLCRHLYAAPPLSIAQVRTHTLRTLNLRMLYQPTPLQCRRHTTIKVMEPRATMLPVRLQLRTTTTTVTTVPRSPVVLPST